MAITIDHYKAYGQQRPPKDVLETYLERLAESTRATTRLVVADMHIDMACHNPSAPETHIRLARTALEAALHCLYEQNGGDMGAFSRSDAFCAVGALLRLAELDNWERAAKRAPLKNSYMHLLTAAYQAEQFVHNDHADAEAHLIEFMTVLLGSRGEGRPHLVGWIGRQALQREDRGLWGNWDCAVTDGTPMDYQSPRVTLEVKKKYVEGGANPGSTAVRLRARGLQFDHPTSIIASCLGELGNIPPGLPNEPPFNSARLDDITIQIHQRITQQVR